MRTLISIILAIALLMVIAGCSSKSGRLADKKEKEMTHGISAITVEYSTGTYKVLNDSVAVRYDNVYFRKARSGNTRSYGEWRYYRVE